MNATRKPQNESVTAPGICECGCGGTTQISKYTRVKDGYVAGQYRRFAAGHRVRPSAEQRFWSRVDKDGPIPESRPELGPCWMWTGGKNTKGYGNVRAGGKDVGAHRAAYELAYGPIPQGMKIDHACHTPACVRPKHLRITTNKQNGENRAGAQANSKSGVRGVYWCAERQKWRAQVGHNGQLLALGNFATVEEADAAARAKRVELFTHNDADHESTPEPCCKHCGLRIKWENGYGQHLEGSYQGKGRCGEESGLPYGYNAEPAGEPCRPPCLGSSTPEQPEGENHAARAAVEGQATT